jgi:hypothetical protein
MQKRVATTIQPVKPGFTKYRFDPAAYEDDLLHDLMDQGWSFSGVEEGLFEAMTPNGVKIGPITPDELFWADCGYQAGLLGSRKTSISTSR